MVKYLKVYIYDCTVVFLIEPTKVQFELMYHDNVTMITDEEYRQMYKDVFENKKVGGFFTPLDCGDYVCCVKDAMSFSSVAHEIGHLAIGILWRNGIEIKNDNDEPFTYLDGWLTNQYYTWLMDEKVARIERLKENNG